jgi:AsmA protein
MDLTLLLASQASKATNNLRGKLQTDLTLSGSGKQWPAIRQSMRGNGKLAVHDGALQGINIVDSAVTSVTGIAGLSNFISPRVRKKYPQLFGSSDTPFDQLGGTFQIADGRATTNDLLLSARDYTVNGKGYFSFEQEVDFTATLVASENLTADIIADVKEARYLTGNSDRLEIPFRLEGTLPNARLKPDSGFIANALQRAIVDKGLDSLFKKGKKKDDEESGADTAPRKPNPTEDLIKKGLDSLFGR